MVKALLRRQIMEMFKGNSRRKRKKPITWASVAASILLIIVLFSLIFFAMASNLVWPLCSVGLDWFYFALMGGLALLLGVIGSAFSTYTSLYQAKDNDLLLSMPIPPSKILFVRLLAVLANSFLFIAPTLAPALVAYKLEGFNGGNVVLSVLSVIILTFLVAAISCLFGWLISLIANKIKNKSYITVILALLFLGLYYYVYFNIMGNAQELIAQGILLADRIKESAYPIYVLGQGIGGHPVEFAILAVVCIAAFLIVYYVMSKTFIKVVTTNTGEKKKAYVYKDITRSQTVKNAIFKKELKRFTSDATYMLNTGLGSVFMLVIAVMMVIKKNDIMNLYEILNQAFGDAQNVLIIGVLLVGLITASMNNMSAPSISIEGKTRWIYQTLPVRNVDVANQKKKVQLLVTMIPLILMYIVVSLVLGMDIISIIAIVVSGLILTYVKTDMDLLLGMTFKNFDWTSIAQPVKRSMAVFIALLASWLLIVIVGAIYYLIVKGDANIFCLILSIVGIVIGLLLDRLISKKAITMFD